MSKAEQASPPARIRQAYDGRIGVGAETCDLLSAAVNWALSSFFLFWPTFFHPYKSVLKLTLKEDISHLLPKDL